MKKFLNWKSAVGRRRFSWWTISSSRLRLSFTLLCMLTLLGCNEKWTIEQVFINPTPLGGVDSVRPVVLVAPPVGSPGGLSVEQGVEIEVRFRRDAGFNGGIQTVIEIYYYPPSGGRFVTEIYGWVPSNSNSIHTAILRATCTRIEHENGQDSVGLFV